MEMVELSPALREQMLDLIRESIELAVDVEDDGDGRVRVRVSLSLDGKPACSESSSAQIRYPD